MSREKIRNLAIIAHVDHGKTTLVDCLLRESGTIREGSVKRDLIMDSNPQERERGITIFAKNCAVDWNGYKINLIDTPGHADFGVIDDGKDKDSYQGTDIGNDRTTVRAEHSIFVDR